MEFKEFDEEKFKIDTDTIDLTNSEIADEAIATLQKSYFNHNDGYRKIEKVSLLAIHLLQQENKELHNKIDKANATIDTNLELIEHLGNKIDKAVEVIHTQMKSNPNYKENLKIIENNLIKGTCRVCDLTKESDVNE